MTVDCGYVSEGSYAALEKLKTLALIPPQPGAKNAAAVAARRRMASPLGRDAAFDRHAHAEGAISELKGHGADRGRCRGTRLLQLQLLAAATAINLKRLLAAGHAATDGQTGNPGTRTAAIRILTGLLVATLTEIDRVTTADGFPRARPRGFEARRARWVSVRRAREDSNL